MFEKLIKRKFSPYLLEVMVLDLIFFIVLSFVPIFVYYLPPRSSVSFMLWCLGTWGIWLIICFLDLIDHRPAVMFLLHDKRKDDTFTKNIKIYSVDVEDVYYMGGYSYLRYVFSDPDITRHLINYKSDQGDGYFRMVFMMDKAELWNKWAELEPEMFCEIEVYKKSRILKEIRPIEGHDYPEGVPEIIRIVNQMYP